METKNIAIFGGVGLAALFVVYKIGTSQNTGENYSGPSVITGSGPLISPTSPSVPASGGAGNDVAAVANISAQSSIEQTRQAAELARVTALSQTNVSLVDRFLEKVGANRLQNNALNFEYNNTGQLTGFSFVKALQPQTELQKAEEQAKILTTQQNAALAAIKRGFLPDENAGAFTAAKQIMLDLQTWQTQQNALKRSGGAVGA